MATARDILMPHLEAALKEAAALKIPGDPIGRVLLEKAIALWRETRSEDDIRAELLDAAEHLDPDEDFTFMRP
jgi:hypothetical protein